MLHIVYYTKWHDYNTVGYQLLFFFFALYLSAKY